MNAITHAEQAAILAGCERINIPYAKLRLSSEYQARKLSIEQRKALPAVQALTASIQTLGVLQNLIVVQANDGGYDVCAGGNRWVAIGINVEAGVFDANYAVPCLVIPAEHAHHASLIENTARAAMHPADVFDSYARLRNEGMTVATIAAAHGANEAAVRKLLALVDVSPADWWEPTVASYLGRVSKDQIAAVVGQVAGQEAAAPLAKMKKAEAAAQAEKILAGKGWLPAVLAVKQLKTDA